MNLQLRPWQTQATLKALQWLVQDRRDRHFLVNAAPGAGKTLCAVAIAAKLLELGEIDRVVVIAPRTEVVNQWSREYERVTARQMVRVTATTGDLAAFGVDVCATWSAVEGLEDAFRRVCGAARTLVVCDEHHHAAVEAAWGLSAESAFVDARFVLVLTGTPVRSDGAQSVWIDQDRAGRISHPADGSFTLTYGEAVDLEYCRPVTFHRHEGRFTVDLESGQSTEVSGVGEALLPKDLARIPGLQATLKFERLVYMPQFVSGTNVPAPDGYHASMLEAAIEKLDDLRLRMPRAGGLVVAPNIEMADYFADLLERLEGERPMVVHTQTQNPEGRIQAFRGSDHRWLVSVAMVSEGVDIPRLRVLVYLPYAKTELAFRQAVGRVVRSFEPGDDTRAYFLMPTLTVFDEYARRIEDEIVAHGDDPGAARQKKCPICERQNALGAATCDGCGHEFPKAAARTRPCPSCGTANALGAKNCTSCGANMRATFRITLDEAMRDGAIVNGATLTEFEVREGEALAPHLREGILRSGDEKLIRILRVLPEESYARLAHILQGAARAPT